MPPVFEEELEARQVVAHAAGLDDETKYITQEYLSELEAEMLQAADNLEFERAAQLRDRVRDLQMQLGQVIPVGDESKPGFARHKGRDGKRLRKKKTQRGRNIK